MSTSGSTDGSILCSVCRSGFEGNAQTTTTPCDHKFHFACLLRWMQRSDTCPDCRQNLYETEEIVNDNPEPINIQGLTITGISRMPVLSASNITNGRLGASRSSRATQQSDTDENHIRGEIDLREEIMTGILHNACRMGNLSSMREILSENPQILYSYGEMGDYLIHSAVLSDNESVLNYLIQDHRFDVNILNDNGMSALHYASLASSLRMVTILVNRNTYVDPRNLSGKTPLMLACENDDEDICEFLLDRGSSLRTYDHDGNSPLHLAVINKSYGCVRMILTRDIDIEVTNFLNETPLHLGCKQGYHTICRFLLESGADTSTENIFGNSPLDEANKHENPRLTNLICRYAS